MRNWNVAIVLLAIFIPCAAQAAPLKPDDAVYKAVMAGDAAVFGASNRCDLETMGKYFTDDLEFYHDNSGLSVGKADLLQKTKANICGKMVRELVPGSVIVYPLPGFGAVQVGRHRFLHPAEPNNIGEAEFIHVWQLKDGAWKISRVLSFDHQAARN